MVIGEVQQLVGQGGYEFSIHAQGERLDEDLDVTDIEAAILQGEILEDYPGDPRGESCLILGFAGQKPVHVVLGWARRGDRGERVLRIITVYVPRAPKWRPTHQRGRAMTDFGDCTFCRGEVEEQGVEYDYRRRGRLLVISNVPAGVCRQCGEKYFTPDVLKKMDDAYHDIFDRHKEPDRLLEVPAVSF